MPSIINILMSTLGLIAFIWILDGTPLGIVFLVLGLVVKDSAEKVKFIKWAKIGLGGLILLPIIFILYATLGFVETVLGLPLISR